MPDLVNRQAPKVYEWQCPPVETSGEQRKGWFDELVQNGDRWLQGQPGIRNSVQDIRLLIGEDQNNQLKTNTPSIGYQDFR